MRLNTILRTAAAASVVAILIGAKAAVAQIKTYSTEFEGTESPLSEGGVWSHVGLDWTKVQKANGIAFGTQTGLNGYDDSYAVLSGFGANQSASAKVHLSGSLDPSCSHEVEILLRWSDSDHSARGYEVNLSFDGGYAQIVRWNGPLGNFTVLGGGSFPGLKHGDTFAASIDGNLIKLSINGRAVAEVRDSTFATGNPGVGFFRRGCGTNADVGLQNFTVSGTDEALAKIPNPPTTVTVN